MSNSFASFRRLPREIHLYLWSWGLLGFGYFGIFGVLFNLYLLRLGYGPATIGTLVALGQLVWGLAAIPSGLVGGRVGNRIAMLWGAGILALATGLLLSVEFLAASLQTGWIAFWWITSWIGSSLLLVNGAPYVMAVSAAEDRRFIFTLQQVFLGLFGFAGSLAAGLLPSFFAGLTGVESDAPIVYWYALWLAPISYLVALLLIARTPRLLPFRAETHSSERASIPLFIIVFVALIVFLQTAGEGTVRAFFNVYLDTYLQVPIARIGVIMGLGQILPVLSSFAAPSVIARRGTGGTIILSGIISALFMLVLAFFTHWFGATIGYIGILLTVSIAAVARSIFSQESVEPQWRTLMSAAYTIGLAMGWGIAAGLGGFLIDNFGYRSLFLLGAVMAASSVLLVFLYQRTLRAAKAQASLPSAP